MAQLILWRDFDFTVRIHKEIFDKVVEFYFGTNCIHKSPKYMYRKTGNFHVQENFAHFCGFVKKNLSRLNKYTTIKRVLKKWAKFPCRKTDSHICEILFSDNCLFTVPEVLLPNGESLFTVIMDGQWWLISFRGHLVVWMANSCHI